MLLNWTRLNAFIKKFHWRKVSNVAAGYSDLKADVTVLKLSTKNADRHEEPQQKWEPRFIWTKSKGCCGNIKWHKKTWRLRHMVSCAWCKNTQSFPEAEVKSVRVNRLRLMRNRPQLRSFCWQTWPNPICLPTCHPDHIYFMTWNFIPQ